MQEEILSPSMSKHSSFMGPSMLFTLLTKLFTALQEILALKTLRIKANDFRITKAKCKCYSAAKTTLNGIIKCKFLLIT